MKVFKIVVLTILCILLFSLTERPLYAGIAPENIREQKLHVSSQARQFIESREIPKLADDEYFWECLGDALIRDELTEDDKVDTFYLLLKTIGWSFAGAVRIPEGYSYFEVFARQSMSFLNAQNSLQTLDYNVQEFLQIALRDYEQHVAHASHALVLAMLLNPETSKTSLEFFLDQDVLQKAQVPAILLHYLAFSVVLSRQYTAALKMNELMSSVSSEQGREDILCALGMFSTDETLEAIKKIVLTELEEQYNYVADTGVLIVRQHLSDSDFYSYFMELVEDSKKKFSLNKLKDRHFQSRLWWYTDKKVMIKIWDDFQARVYDDGMLMTYGEVFADFL
ncbi:hypothetical protein CSA56_08340 [candidate division KSB3 bacterium]|uniref:Uncharacterized protein n=1 Tax=candidate division KSB3 bacterium TaxID=2044937 RepID=A0A2G6KH49_9BACT|nr:MAG: hypothetical protein CSA56_08340 [candidate division KSB3 bacterium]